MAGSEFKVEPVDGDGFIVTWNGGFIARRDTKAEAYALCEALRRARKLFDAATSR